jgi:NitT/TauT family transport system permease protein
MGYVSYCWEYSIAAGGLGVLIKNGDRLGANGRVIAVQGIIILVGISLDFY